MKTCVSCRNFRYSGMSHQMSDGASGYCSLVGFRNRRGIVRTTFVCGEHDSDPSGTEMDVIAKRADFVVDGTRKNAFAGSMLGLAVGDALGFPTEFRTRAQILAAFPPEGVTDFVGIRDARWPERPMILSAMHPPGTVSDDTQMALAVAHALVEAGDLPLDELMGAMARRFIAWSISEENDRAPGNACMAGSRKLADGVPWREAGAPDSKGCGSAMRAPPIGLRYKRDLSRLLEVARAQSLLTHGHDAAIEASAAAALLVALALEKRSPEQMYEAVMEECGARSADFAKCFSRVPESIALPPEDVLSKRGLGEGWVAEEAVAGAFYAFWRSPTSFERSVLTAANTDGDSDSLAAIAGAISGAFNGALAIPEEWRATVEKSVELFAVADSLAAFSSAATRS